MALNLVLILWLSIARFFGDTSHPTFKGGEKNLSIFISRNLIYPEYAKQNCLQGTINISFKLNRAGRIFNSRIEKGYGIDLDAEALRIVRLTSGKWQVPAGFDTTQSIVIPINFNLKEYNCNQRTPDEIKEAIAAYRNRQDLTRAVLNFYDKKAFGTYMPDDEAKIVELKAQLGYNDRFIDRLIRQGQQKVRQGDLDGACEDFRFVKKLGSEKANSYLSSYCAK